jgi:hypothetical protein
MLPRMNRWDELITGPRADALRALLCNAAAIAHTENGTRHDPEDLGDDALIYGICTTHNARHVAARFVEDSDLQDVAVCERGRVWWLEIQRPEGAAVRVYFYKAPLGARTVCDVRLDDAEIKKELSSSNGRQMELFNRSGGEGNAQLLNLIVVHYGDAVTGLEKLDVGAPYVTADGIAWDWYERFDSAEPSTAETAPAVSPSLGDDGAGFAGLRLVTPPDSDNQDAAEDHGSHPAAKAEPESAKFEALGLRDGIDKSGKDAGTGGEPS